jgi:hypothetical protein
VGGGDGRIRRRLETCLLREFDGVGRALRIGG